MHDSVRNLKSVQNNVKEIANKTQLKTIPQIIAVTKTFPFSVISPLIEIGHIHFGENKIQEAESKWIGVKSKNKNLQLHMIGSIQSNKAKKAIKLFDYIHSLDNAKLASKLNQFEKELNKKVKIFIQVNLDREIQKGGIAPNEVDNFFKYCTKDLSLNIVGLMCIPPFDQDSEKYFQMLKELGKKLNVSNFSMGMSQDYKEAILNGSTFLRLGTTIFGKRSS